MCLFGLVPVEFLTLTPLSIEVVYSTSYKA